MRRLMCGVMVALAFCSVAGRVEAGQEPAAQTGQRAPGDLIDLFIRSPPIAPLGAIDRSQFTVFIGPLIPDRHPVIAQVLDIGPPLEKPEQLMDDRTQMQLFRR